MFPRCFMPAALAALAAFPLAGCSDDNGTAPGPSTAVVSEIGLASEDALDADLSALSIANLYTPIGYEPAAVTRGPAALTVPACVSLEPATPADADHDSIPDDVTATFDCSASTTRFTLARTGALRIQDANAENAFDLRQTLLDVAWSLTDNSGDRGYSATWNGNRMRTGTPTLATLTIDLSVVRARAHHDTAVMVRSGTVTLTPVAGDSLVIDQPLPSGTIVVDGLESWVRGNENFSFTVSTHTPLSYDASCSGVQRISAGELWFTGTVNTQAGYLRLTWTGCDFPPTRHWVATATS